MKEILTVKSELTEHELKSLLIHISINPPVGVIVTRPQDISLAQEFNTDVLQMFDSRPEDVASAARDISTGAEALVIVIGENNVDSAG